MHVLMEKKKKIIDVLFNQTQSPQKWEIYLPLDGSNEFVLLQNVCSKCGSFWSMEDKECFYCKTKYLRVKICPECNQLNPENVRFCKYCYEKEGKKVATQKKCLNCGAVEGGRKRVFVPITFCWNCGNRENKFKCKLIKIENGKISEKILA